MKSILPLIVMILGAIMMLIGIISIVYDSKWVMFIPIGLIVMTSALFLGEKEEMNK